MDRRDFLTGIAGTGTGAWLLGTLGATAGAGSALAESAAAEAAATGAASARALADLHAAIAEVEDGFRRPEWRLSAPGDFAEGRAALLQALQHALEVWFRGDPERPVFKRFVTPEKKLLGDNPDAFYFNTLVAPEYRYRIRANLAGATYTSFTVELGTQDGGTSKGIGATLNDAQFEAAADGSYEIVVSAERPAGHEGNWLRLDPGAGSISTRHYYEREQSIAADRLHHVPIAIENIDAPGPPPAPTDASIALGIERVARFLRGAVVPPSAPERTPRWVSTVPNQLPAPKRDASNQEIGFAAVDNVYSMAPFVLMPGEALVIRGRYPRCRFANVVLWNRFLQTLDYVNRRNSLNRKQTALEADGSFKIVVAHRDPGVPNWLDTEGRSVGTIFWRFQLPEEEIEPLRTQVVRVEDVGAA